MNIAKIFSNFQPKLSQLEPNKNVAHKFKRNLITDVFQKSTAISEKVSTVKLEDGSKFELKAILDGAQLNIKRKYFDKLENIIWTSKMNIDLSSGEIVDAMAHRGSDNKNYTFNLFMDKNGNVYHQKGGGLKVYSDSDKGDLIFPNGDRFEILTEEDTSIANHKSFVINGRCYNSKGELNWQDELRINRETGEFDIQTQNSEGDDIVCATFHRNSQGDIDGSAVKY